MARVLAFIPDLLFGSRVLADLRAAGHDVELVGDLGAARARVGDAEVLIVDLTAESPERARLVEGLREAEPAAVQAVSGLRVLGFYSHVDTATREHAEQAGFDMVVPRSRMAREGAALVARLGERR